MGALTERSGRHDRHPTANPGANGGHPGDHRLGCLKTQNPAQPQPCYTIGPEHGRTNAGNSWRFATGLRRYPIGS